MAELEREVRNWRARLERRSSLSVGELDELEDHLRARIDLELELNAALAPVEAMAIAREGLGPPEAISREFVKAGRLRWRRWLWAAWALYAASFFLPAVIIAGVVGASGGVVDFMVPGYEVWVRVWREGELGPPLVVLLINLHMLATLPALWRSRSWRMPSWLVGTVGVLALGIGAMTVAVPTTLTADGTSGVGQLGPGYWAWSAAFVCAAIALRNRNRDAAAARPKVRAHRHA